MIGSEYGFHNENDYSESDMEMKLVICLYYEEILYMMMQLIYRELIRFYNILTY